MTKNNCHTTGWLKSRYIKNIVCMGNLSKLLLLHCSPLGWHESWRSWPGQASVTNAAPRPDEDRILQSKIDKIHKLFVQFIIFEQCFGELIYTTRPVFTAVSWWSTCAPTILQYNTLEIYSWVWFHNHLSGFLAGQVNAWSWKSSWAR